FDTHLDYRPDTSVRRAQVTEMLDIMGRIRDPVILLGDLNAPPYAPELAPLVQRLGDAWVEGQGRAPRRGRSAEDSARGDEGAGGTTGRTYPASAPTKRIDYVLVSPGLRVLRARVVDTGASDHRPVVVSLDVPAGGISPQRPAGTS
ncbi:MAG: endonuclease/exonuclease/phosphatase family protein, partial [Gemmatimonadota bacterium]